MQIKPKLFEKEFLKTEDGSFTIFLPEMEETYHSKHGAVTESKHVFLENGLLRLLGNEKITVLEVGWGTGLNSLLAWQWAEENNQKLDYLAIEPYPLVEQEWRLLSYENHLNSSTSKSYFSKLHETAWEENQDMSEYFSFRKTIVPVERTDIPSSTIDIIFYDAFAPKKQPEMWHPARFENCYRWLSKQGILTTYCANGQFKRDLKSVGFYVTNPRGPFGKREMTVALKNQ